MNQNKMKTIIIKSNNKSIFEGLNNVFARYSSYSFTARIIEKLIKNMKLSFFEPIFYGKWKKLVGECELAILFDNDSWGVDTIARYLKKNNPNIKVIFWYWNPLALFNNRIVDSKYIDEIWTYDRFDAKKYGLKYNTQFYRTMPFKKEKKEKRSDLIFLGIDKGREKTLMGLEKAAISQGLNCNFHIVISKKDKVDYLDYLRDVINSKCVVDLVPDQQCGMTLRPLEALFFGKKLITNYQDIVNYDFYNKSNIFVIGKDDMDKLADFINSLYTKIDRKIIDFYSYESWLKRIEKGEDVKV